MKARTLVEDLRMRTLLLSICLIALVHANAAADGSTYKTSTGVTYTADDTRQAVNAVLRIPTDHSFSLFLETYPANQLPAWDAIAHYVGPKHLPNGRFVYDVALSDRYSAELQDIPHARHAVAVALVSAEFMAVMDAGRAGRKWKSLFGHAAATDAKLPSSVFDRYTNRHALVAHLADSQTILYSSIGGGTVMLDSAGNPLTEHINYSSGLIGAARLGVGSSRVSELFENPDGLKTAAAQAFINDWFKHFSAVLPPGESRSILASQRSLLVVTPTADLASNQRRFDQAINELLNGLDINVALAFGIGHNAAAARYSATVIRNTNEDGQLRYVIARTDTLDATIPRMQDMRARLGALSSGDWSEITSVSSEIIHAILSGS
jgi:hypothetical protein